jgi:chitinase
VLTKPKPKPTPPAPQVTAQNLAEGQTVTGLVDWRAHTIGPVARVQFVVDGTVIATATTEPWATTWDSSTVAPGAHTLEVRAFTSDGRRSVARVSVTSSAG